MSNKEVDYLAVSGDRYKWRPGPVDTENSSGRRVDNLIYFGRMVSALNEQIDISIEFEARLENLLIKMSEKFKNYIKDVYYPAPFRQETENIYMTYRGVPVEIDDSVEFFKIVERGGIGD